tara:strand:- start:2722 stop:3894 length:1173 start_codon:yes stop_codon:yes gene_type:complete
MQNKNYMGLSGFVWWQGVVEDRKDPLKLGRCRVRILGFHTDNKKDIPTESLPWAYPAMPLNMNPGSTPIGPQEGTWVLGFFRDGENAQEPIMTDMIDYGYVTKNDPNKGFNDPETNTDKPEKPSGVTEPKEVNTNKLAVGESGGTLLGERSEESGINSTSGSWDEPKSEYNPKYPYNNVMESESGHILEVDDTKGSERININHRSGTFDEYHPDGSKVTKIIGDNYELTLKGKNVYVAGNINIHTDGNYDIDTDGNYKIKSDSDISIESSTKIEFKVGDNTITIDPEKIDITCTNLEVEGDEFITLNSKEIVLGVSEEIMISYAALKTAAGPLNPDPISKAAALAALEIMETSMTNSIVFRSLGDPAMIGKVKEVAGVVVPKDVDIMTKG